MHSKILSVSLWPLLTHMHIHHMYIQTTLKETSFAKVIYNLPSVFTPSQGSRQVCFLLYHDFSSRPLCHLDPQ